MLGDALINDNMSVINCLSDGRYQCGDCPIGKLAIAMNDDNEHDNHSINDAMKKFNVPFIHDSKCSSLRAHNNALYNKKQLIAAWNSM